MRGQGVNLPSYILEKLLSSCCSELGSAGSSRGGWCAPQLDSESLQCLCRTKQCSPHWALTGKYFGCVPVPSFLHGYLSLCFGFLIPLSSSALVPHLPFLSCWLFRWSGGTLKLDKTILVPMLAFKPCPDSKPRAEVLKMNFQECGAPLSVQGGGLRPLNRGFDSGIDSRTEHGSGF